MTTPIVPSISDEQLEDINNYCARPIFKDDAHAPVTMGEIRGLIARLRAAEADAKRYQWLTGSNPTMGILERMTRGELIGHEIDMVIDRAMERAP
ncbi:hypothetical protein [Bowmanella yangjiangensis]|uniref:Antitoxin Xre/MbcA/ParS-like toxin-binding domain-containing protein n=1 Tax=Bowmanella yangjiangensis TaxID=2811230 RepID=A0ABS3CYK6_9ALTE|nr:hypothetical protein [Bowmanella yangjiangensis]MBN7822212.1 hypothetical protein [Bowmanella yangjiangensis]